MNCITWHKSVSYHFSTCKSIIWEEWGKLKLPKVLETLLQKNMNLSVSMLIQVFFRMKAKLSSNNPLSLSCMLGSARNNNRGFNTIQVGLFVMIEHSQRCWTGLMLNIFHILFLQCQCNMIHCCCFAYKNPFPDISEFDTVFSANLTHISVHLKGRGQQIGPQHATCFDYQFLRQRLKTSLSLWRKPNTH